MFRIFPILFFFFCLAPAEGKTPLNLKPQAQKLEDPGSATPLLYKKPSQTESLNKKALGSVKATTTCTDSFGMVTKEGDKSYEACLRRAGKSKTTNTNEKNPNSVGFTIGN